MNPKLSLNGLHFASLLPLAGAAVLAYLQGQSAPVGGHAWEILGLGALSAAGFAIARSILVPTPEQSK